MDRQSLMFSVNSYKDVKKIRSDKYFGLIGNLYNYSVSSGYSWGYMSITFYSYGDSVLYNVFTQSIFNTNLPKGNDYTYAIKGNDLYLNGSYFCKIVSFNGTKLVLRINGTTYTLTKS